MVELEAAAGPDPRGHAPESAVVKDHARTPNRTRTPIRPPGPTRLPRSGRRRPRVPLPVRPPRAAARPPGLGCGPAPSSEPRPRGSAPPPAARGLGSGGEMGPGGHDHTWTAGRCVRAHGGPSPCPRASPPRAPGPHRCPAPPAAAGPLRGGGRGRDWLGPSSARALRAGAAAEGDHPSPSGRRLDAAQRRPGTRWRDRRGADRELGQLKAAQAAAKAWALWPARPGLQSQPHQAFKCFVPQFPHL